MASELNELAIEAAITKTTVVRDAVRHYLDAVATGEVPLSA